MNTELKTARESKKMTQAEVAAVCNITTNAYQRYELGTRTPSVRTAIRIADALGITNLRELWKETANR